jgi:hypothetical protein
VNDWEPNHSPAIEPLRVPAAKHWSVESSPAIRRKIKNAANFFAAFPRPAFRLPTRLAVGFGLDALEASGLIHPGRWQAVTQLVPPFLGAED